MMQNFRVHPRTVNRWESGHTEIPKWRARAMRELEKASADQAVPA